MTARSSDSVRVKSATKSQIKAWLSSASVDEIGSLLFETDGAKAFHLMTWLSSRVKTEGSSLFGTLAETVERDPLGSVARGIRGILGHRT